MDDADSTVFYVITGAYTLYVFLCGLALWSTFQSSSSSSRTLMRVLLIAMLLVLTATFSIQAIQHHVQNSGGEYMKVALENQILGIASNVATCLAGVLSDGLLAWRCFVLFGKRPWMKWLLTAVVALDFAIGSLSNIALSTLLRFMQVPHSAVNSLDTMYDNVSWAQKLVDVWAWLFFALNTSMTMSIIYKIFSSATRAKVLAGPCKDHYVYNTVIRAIIESSLITWMGLLAYAISATMVLSQSNSDIILTGLKIYGTTDISQMKSLNTNAIFTSEYAFMFLPFIFGISQTLIIARIGFSRLRSPSKAAKRTAAVLASNHHVEEEERVDFVLDITKGRDDVEMCTTSRSSTLV